jgi:hypothetical protein
MQAEVIEKETFNMIIKECISTEKKTKQQWKHGPNMNLFKCDQHRTINEQD